MTTPKDLSGFGLPFWLDIERPEFPSLEHEITAEAVVIGAGIAGLKLARCLNRHGIQTVILEGDRAGQGASSRNQGSINHSAGMTYQDCIAQSSRDTARGLWKLGLENHRLVREQIDEYQIDCGYQADGMTSLVRRDAPGCDELLATYRRECELLTEDGFEVTFLDEVDAVEAGGNSIFIGGMRYETDGQFHSGKFVLGLAEAVAGLPHVQLFEHTPVLGIKRDGQRTQVVTERHTVTTERVFLGTNALAPQFIPNLEQALRAERGQVIVTEPINERPCLGSFGTWMAWWREIIEPDGRFRLLLGGARERDEPDSLFPQYSPDGRPHPKLATEGFRPSHGHQQRLDEQFAILFPQLADVRITHRWGGLQSFTADDLPEIGLLDEERQIYGIAGFCGRGNGHSDIGAEYVVGKAIGIKSEVERRFGALIEESMAVQRPSAEWGSWQTLHNDDSTH